MSTMRVRRWGATLGLVAWLWGGMVQADTTIVIVRHGEKPPAGLGQLSCQGLNRALALPRVLMARYGKPSAIYAPNPSAQKEDKGVAYAYVRPLTTIEPFAIQAGLPVNIHWAMTDAQALSQYLAAQGHGTHVVAWEHHWAETLARALVGQAGGDASVVPHWDDADFDSIYVVRLKAAAEGQPVRAAFSLDHQGLNGRPESCPH